MQQNDTLYYPKFDWRFHLGQCSDLQYTDGQDCYFPSLHSITIFYFHLSGWNDATFIGAIYMPQGWNA